MSNRYCRYGSTVVVVIMLATLHTSSLWSQTPATQASKTKSVPNGTPAAPQSNQPTFTQHDLEHAALMHLIESIEPYHMEKEIKGTAILSGSTTMLAIGKSWADRFRNFHPNVVFTRGADGTDAGLKSL